MKGLSMTLAAGLGLAAAGCGSSGVTPPAAVGPAAPPPRGSLAESERRSAEATVLEAVAKGESMRWYSSRPGYYGFVEPGAASDDGWCRAFSHTIFLDGLPTRESGRACRAAGGPWRLAPAA